MTRTSFLPLALALAGAALCGAALSGCVAYTALDQDLASVATEVRARAGGRFSFDAAVALALRQNPGLQAAEARARAAVAATAPVTLASEWSSHDDTLGVMLDPLELLGLGPRGGALTVLDAEAAAAAQQLAEERWRVVGAVAEAFLVEGVLARWQVPEPAGDADAFERAGLAARVAAARLRAAQARARAEASEVASLRAQNLDELRRLLGLGATAALEPDVSDGGLLQQPPADADALLQRPDLRVAQARLAVADAGFRAAVADQYPSLMVGPDFPLSGGDLQMMAQLRLPIGMHGRAVAARERRDAALAELEAAWLDAQNGAASAATALEAAQAVAGATAAARRSSDEALRTAVVAVQVEVDAFDALADAAAMAVRDAVEHRMAAIALARAQVRRAVAFGWPLPASPQEPQEPTGPRREETP